MSMNENHDIQLVIITGMSGAGKTVAIQSFEDLGYFASTICRLPCCRNFGADERIKFKMSKVALVMDLRGREFLTG